MVSSPSSLQLFGLPNANTTADVYHYISTVQHAEGLAVGIDVYPFL